MKIHLPINETGRPATVFQKKSWSLRCHAATLFCFLLLTGRVFALDPAKSIFQFNCQNWTRQSGLPASKINTLAQSSDGFIWLGTQNGLIRFDGLEFKAVPVDLPQVQGQEVRQLSPAKAGGLWFAINNGGFGHYDGRKFAPIADERWTRPDMLAYTIYEASDGAVWTGTVLGLGRFVAGSPTNSFFDETKVNASTLSEDASGRIWVTTEAGLAYWANGKLNLFSKPELDGRQFFALAREANGRLWLGTELGLCCYDAEGRRQELLATNAPDMQINALLFDRRGVLWLGTLGHGLGRYQNGKFTFLQKADGLCGDNVTSLLEDAEGSLWVGTSEGLSQLTDVKFPIFSVKDGLLAGSTHSVSAATNGGLWISASTGASYFDGRAFKNLKYNSPLPNPYIRRSFVAANGDVYLGDGDKGIDVLRGDRLLARCIASSWPETFAEDRQGVLVGVGPGLFRLVDGQLKPYVILDNPAPEFGWINCLIVAKDGIIWAAAANGIFRIQDGHYKQWTTLEGLSANRVHYIFEDLDGSIWGGLATGIVRVKEGRIKTITAADGLQDDRVYAIVPDNLGYFWIASGGGFSRVTRQSLNDFADGKATKIQSEAFGDLDSVKFADRTDQAYSGAKTLDGRIWFPNPLGLVMIDPANFFTNRFAPPVHIEQILVNGVELTNRTAASLPGGIQRLEFVFAAPSYLSPRKVRVRYKLEGFDSVWIEAGARRTVLYDNVPPGAYRFSVQAGNADGVWNTTGDVFNFELPLPYYQTRWFYSLCVLAGILVLFGGYRWKVWHMEIRQKKLQAENDLLDAKVGRRTKALATANISLQQEIDHHKTTEAQLKQRTQSLETEIEERKLAQSEVEEVHREVVKVSRLGGMAEIATNVLHNVGNVLNSVNVSTGLVVQSVKKSRSANLGRVVTLLEEHAHDLGDFITNDPKGKQLPAYLAQLSGQLKADQEAMIGELESLRRNVEHIKEIVAMQQSYARVSGVKEIINVNELVEDGLRMSEGVLSQTQVEVVREFGILPPMDVEKHKILQIIVNLIRNAKHACQDSERTDRRLTVCTGTADGRVRISVTDNGVGILPENLTRIFNHGFTTRKDGHGFGLHSGALAAKEMGGSLTVFSDGPNNGATFTLELPLMKTEELHE